MTDARKLAQILPGYDIGAELGRGGYGIVLGGRHKQLGRAVAIKELPPRLAADPAVRARFVAEGRVLASLDHPHIVPVYDFVEKDGVCVLVMEALPGGTVWGQFSSRGYTPSAACAVVMVACAGLHHA
ncbi:MAG: protein kinase, partial [Mycobacteriales bacterium]